MPQLRRDEWEPYAIRILDLIEDEQVRIAVWTALMLIYERDLPQPRAIFRMARRRKVPQGSVAYYVGRVTGDYPPEREKPRSTASAAADPAPTEDALDATEVRDHLRQLRESITKD